MTTILHVTDAAFAGALYAVTDIAREQSRQPHTEIVFTYVPRPESPDIDVIRQLVGPDVDVRRLTSIPRLAVPALIARLAGVITEVRPDLIHLHSSRTGMVGRLLALLSGHRSRVVYSPHGLAVERPASTPAMRRVYGGLERLGARMAPALALCSPSEQQLAHRVIPRARTAVLTNAVEVEQLATIRASTPAGPRRAPLTVAHIGRIAEQKLPGSFSRIADRWAQASRAPARFLWIGDGDRDLLSSSVEITGWLEHEDVLHELARTDLVLFTSGGEGLPIALLEAQSMGIPVIGSRVTGVVDLIEDGVTGVLGDTEDDLLEAFASLAEDPPRRSELGRAAAARMASTYDMSTLAERSFRAYQELGMSIPQLEEIS